MGTTRTPTGSDPGAGSGKKRKKGTGRKKIEMKPIANIKNRRVCYSKRRVGLFKKAEELARMTGCAVSILTFSPVTMKPTLFGNIELLEQAAAVVAEQGQKNNSPSSSLTMLPLKNDLSPGDDVNIGDDDYMSMYDFTHINMPPSSSSTMLPLKNDFGGVDPSPGDDANTADDDYMSMHDFTQKNMPTSSSLMMLPLKNGCGGVDPSPRDVITSGDDYMSIYDFTPPQSLTNYCEQGNQLQPQRLQTVLSSTNWSQNCYPFASNGNSYDVLTPVGNRSSNSNASYGNNNGIFTTQPQLLAQRSSGIYDQFLECDEKDKEELARLMQEKQELESWKYNLMMTAAAQNDHIQVSAHPLTLHEDRPIFGFPAG